MVVTLKTSDERRKAFRAVCLRLFPEGCIQVDLLDDIDTLFMELHKQQNESDNLRAEIISLEDRLLGDTREEQDNACFY